MVERLGSGTNGLFGGKIFKARYNISYFFIIEKFTEAIGPLLRWRQQDSLKEREKNGPLATIMVCNEKRKVFERGFALRSPYRFQMTSEQTDAD